MPGADPADAGSQQGGFIGWANVVTLARIALIPLFVYLMYVPPGGSEVLIWPGFVVFTVAALSDSLDGHIARHWGSVTRLGQMLDPLADKLLVGAALYVLVDLRGFPLWAAVVIAVREVWVSLLRSAALRRGRVMPATTSGKIKTAVQVPMVMLWLLERSGYVALLQDLSVYVVVALTIWSGFRIVTRSRTAANAA